MGKILKMFNHLEIKELLPSLITKWEKNKFKCKYSSFVDEQLAIIVSIAKRKKLTLNDEINISNNFNIINSYIEAPQNVTLDDILLSSDTGNKIKTFLRYASELDDKIYWQELRAAYQLQDYTQVPIVLLKTAFCAKRKFKEFLMSVEERDFVNGLKDTVTIYRGCTKKEVKSGKHGISWTLSKNIAEFFANRKRLLLKDGCITEKNIKKTEIIAYFKDRKEEEIIYWK